MYNFILILIITISQYSKAQQTDSDFVFYENVDQLKVAASNYKNIFLNKNVTISPDDNKYKTELCSSFNLLAQGKTSYVTSFDIKECKLIQTDVIDAGEPLYCFGEKCERKEKITISSSKTVTGGGELSLTSAIGKIITGISFKRKYDESYQSQESYEEERTINLKPGQNCQPAFIGFEVSCMVKPKVELLHETFSFWQTIQEKVIDSWEAKDYVPMTTTVVRESDNHPVGVMGCLNLGKQNLTLYNLGFNEKIVLPTVTVTPISDCFYLKLNK